MSDIKENIRGLADTIKTELSLSEEGVFSVDAKMFENTLPEGLTMETVKKYQEHTADLVTAAGLALGEAGIDAMKKDKRLDQVSLEFNAGKDTIGGVFQRSKEVRSGITADAEMMTKYGILNMKVGVNAHANKGSLKKVRAHLSEEAKKILAS